VPDLLLNSVWPGLVAWTILYCSDYVLTVVCARLYAAGARDKIVCEGSYEITPYFQRDVDSLRRVSPRFLAALVLSSLWLAATWWLSTQSWPLMYAFALGAVILPELAIHVRHIRNLLLFRALVRTDEVRGRLEYSRPLMLRLSSLELLTFSGLFAVLFLFTGSVFVLGGVMTCSSLAAQHWRLARAHSAEKRSSPSLHTAARSADSG
jgi:hypothetical protein